MKWLGAVTAINIAGAFASILAVVISFWPRFSGDTRIAVIFLGSVAWFFIAFALWQAFRWRTRVRRAEAAPHFQEAYRVVFQLISNAPGTFPELKNISKMFCDHLATAFTVAIGRRTAVCIKVLEVADEKGGLAVKALARDAYSDTRRRHKSKEVIHWLRGNTAFGGAFTDTNWPSFFCNNLPGLRGYKNTSFDIYGHPPELSERWKNLDFVRSALNWVLRKFGWRLPYRSTIVSPVLPPHVEYPTLNDLQGFLAVDSLSVNVFQKTFDQEWLEASTFPAYYIISKYNDFQKGVPNQ